ncbi:MAG TPA: hypothetical protein VI524_13555, partial [Anaerolineales bacterium]|nr:hypothetical protein [Anaerolineales bacterium]
QLNEAHRVLTEACSLAEGMGSKHHLWSVLAGLADVSSQLGQQDEAGACQKKARQIVEAIAEELREVGLRELFLDQPRVQALMP